MSDTEKKPFRAVVKADLFLRAQSCVSREEIRYYLNGVHFEPCEQPATGVLMVSTDGHRLICLRDALGFAEGGTAIIKADKPFLDIVKRVASHPKRFCESSLAYLAVVIDGKKIGLVEADSGEQGHEHFFKSLRDEDKFLHAVQWKDTIIDGTFPNWRRVVPKVESLNPNAKHGVINLRILAPLVEALSDGQTHAPRITPGGDAGSPHLVTVSSMEVDGFGIVMPMRAYPSEALPFWMNPPVPPLAKEPKAEEATAPEPKKVEPRTNKARPKKKVAARRAPARRKPAARKPVSRKATPKKTAKKRARAS